MESKFKHPIVEALRLFFEKADYDQGEMYGLASLVEKIPSKKGSLVEHQITVLNRMFIYMLPDTQSKVDAVEGVDAALHVLDAVIEQESSTA